MRSNRGEVPGPTVPLNDRGHYPLSLRETSLVVSNSLRDRVFSVCSEDKCRVTGLGYYPEVFPRFFMLRWCTGLSVFYTPCRISVGIENTNSNSY